MTILFHRVKKIAQGERSRGVLLNEMFGGNDEYSVL